MYCMKAVITSKKKSPRGKRKDREKTPGDVYYNLRDQREISRRNLKKMPKCRKMLAEQPF